MTEAEILHKRKMQLKNEVVKPLVELIDGGADVASILQNLAERVSAGKDIEHEV